MFIIIIVPDNWPNTNHLSIEWELLHITINLWRKNVNIQDIVVNPEQPEPDQ